MRSLAATSTVLLLIGGLVSADAGQETGATSAPGSAEVIYDDDQGQTEGAATEAIGDASMVADELEPTSSILEPVPLQDFHIGVSDTLNISIWKNKELNAKVPVAPDGMISLPLVGDVMAAGRKPADVRADLKERYAEFLNAPEVSLVVSAINSRVIYIIGEVGKQGVHELLLPTTILQALAKAGGLSDYAKKDKIVVLRREGDVEQFITLSIKGVENGKHLEDNILLKPGDTVIVP